MSTALLQELHQEVNRLYIAGSELAAEDFRLKRLLPQFQQLGERAPIFKRLGEGIVAVIEPDHSEGSSSAQNLQELSVLLSSVLYTQGATSPDGELLEVEVHPVRLPTQFSYRKLSAVQTALKTRGGGRYEIIKEAFETGLFKDLRMFHPALAALQDPYVEIAELVMKQILPAYGPQIIPILIDQFDPAGGIVETRKLYVIAVLGGDSVQDLIYKAADSGSEDVRAMAISLLAGQGQYEIELLAWSTDKKKKIREAAYNALAKSDSANAVNRLHEAFTGKDSELVVPALRQCQAQELTKRLVVELSDMLQTVSEIMGDTKKKDGLWNKVVQYLRVLSYKRSPELEKLYFNVLEQYPLYMNQLKWNSLIEEANSYFRQIDSIEARRILQQTLERDLVYYRNNRRYVNDVFKDAYLYLSPERVYEQYVEVLKHYAPSSTSHASSMAQQLLRTISEVVVQRYHGTYDAVWNSPVDLIQYMYKVEMQPPEVLAVQWDSRWLDAFIELDQYELVSAFARPGHAEAMQYLLRKLTDNPEFRHRFSNILLMGLARTGIGKQRLQEALLVALEDDRNTECRLIEPYTFEQLCQLPASFASRIITVLPRFSEVAEEQLEYVIRLMQGPSNPIEEV
ncbi:HEAT repeat domain-containing protein [Paenibacillus sp. B2(2019)]|uniref:HEAT repeat domain-containing protein n=1 Tax=Paenibacillus sp. B2(2019) TaxID=2607754 RepID=UPI0011F3B456|nr:HEAT repeat domain-containing protein [Paenibacillus sp. B2(2019)]KAA1180646.1 HEAT repeat domain-containing protein [Paenibacillus sp. B2(2019)]